MYARTLCCSAVAFLIAMASAGADEAETVPADWFQLDPYSELGYDTAFGDGLNFMRLAAHAGCREELKLTKELQGSLQALKRAHEDIDSAKEKELVLEFGKLPGDVWAKFRSENWNDAMNLTRTMLTEAQSQRIDQLLVRKQGYRGFSEGRVAKQLELSDEERDQIRTAITDHAKRVRENKAEGKERAAAGVASHRRAWDDIYKALKPEQREKYLALRGPVEH